MQDMCMLKGVATDLTADGLRSFEGRQLTGAIAIKTLFIEFWI